MLVSYIQKNDVGYCLLSLPAHSATTVSILVSITFLIIISFSYCLFLCCHGHKLFDIIIIKVSTLGTSVEHLPVQACLQYYAQPCNKTMCAGGRDGIVVIALAFHLRPRVQVTSGLSWFLVLYSAPRGFSPGSPVFPSPQKSTFPNSNSIRSETTFG